MATVLYDKIVFGPIHSRRLGISLGVNLLPIDGKCPIHSRRLGISLGVNLLPIDGKCCSFNCIYCECGLNEERRPHSKMPTRQAVKEALEERLSAMQAAGTAPDVITFAGNGEPTLHPDFAVIIDDTIALRDRFFPKAKIAVLSNSTMLHKEDVFRALNRVEDNIMKFDSILDSRIQQLNAPVSPTFTFDRLLEQLCRFNGNVIIQTMFLKGEVNGESVTNTTEHEVSGWLEALKQIRPKQVMIYTLDRETPIKNLRKVPKEELDAIAERVRKEGFDVTVSA